MLKIKDLNNVTKYSLIFSSLLIGFSVFYYFVILLPRIAEFRDNTELLKISTKESEKNDQELKEKIRVANIDACIEAAGQNYLDIWNENCESKGLGPRCALDQKVADGLAEFQKTEADYCFKKFPAN